jgi:hypothetical protein
MYNPELVSPERTIVVPFTNEVYTCEYERNPASVLTPEMVDEIAAVIAPFVVVIALDLRTPLEYESPDCAYALFVVPFASRRFPLVVVPPIDVNPGPCGPVTPTTP